MGRAGSAAAADWLSSGLSSAGTGSVGVSEVDDEAGGAVVLDVDVAGEG